MYPIRREMQVYSIYTMKYRTFLFHITIYTSIYQEIGRNRHQRKKENKEISLLYHIYYSDYLDYNLLNVQYILEQREMFHPLLAVTVTFRIHCLREG